MQQLYKKFGACKSQVETVIVGQRVRELMSFSVSYCWNKGLISWLRYLLIFLFNLRIKMCGQNLIGRNEGIYLI